jgi:glutathione S-transferase
MKLYYKAGSCSLAPHIVMAELGMAYELEAVDLATKVCASGDFRKINPKGSVPAIKMDNGEILTEGAVISQYLADQKFETTLVPKFGTLERYRCMEWMNFVATEVHKTLGTMFAAGNIMKSAESQTELRAGLAQVFEKKMAYLSESLGDQSYLMGETFTIADAYLFTCLSWTKMLKVDLSAWKNIKAYQERVLGRPAVQKAMKEEGLL